MSSARSTEAWERVLAAIEADTARAAALLADDPHAAGMEPAELARIAVAAGQGYGPPAGTPRAPADAVGAAASAVQAPSATQAGTGDAPMTSSPAAGAIPATWRLPARMQTTDALTAEPLPDPADMPPMPAELRERIERLRTRIAALQADLGKALAEIRLTPKQVRIPTEEVRPGYVDRTL